MNIIQHLTQFGRCTHYDNERGAVLGTSLVLLAVLTLLGSAAIMTAMTDTKIAGNFKTGIQAFNNAEAGIHHIVASLANGLAGGMLTLDEDAETYTITTPSGFSFDAPNAPDPDAPDTYTFTRVGATKMYRFNVRGYSATGYSGDISSTEIEVVVRRPPLMSYGLFGDTGVNLASSRSIYDYSSSTTPTPTAATSSGQAHVASNGSFQAGANLYVDGNMDLGDDNAGTEGSFTYSDSATVTVTGTTGADVERITSDPLGVSGGAWAPNFVDASLTNNNIFVGITGNTLDVTTGTTLTLTDGTYYLESAMLHAGSSLNIDTSGGGKVKIYLVGPFTAQFASRITFNGTPKDFSIYSNSDQPLSFNHFGTFKGTIYAPYADVAVNNLFPATYYGMLWAKSVSMNVDTAGTFYIDRDTLDEYPSDTVSIVSWRDVRD